LEIERFNVGTKQQRAANIAQMERRLTRSLHQGDRVSHRKGETTSSMNEREFPHLVELALPPGGFLGQELEFR
jgi:hypothetical protein